MRAVPRSAQTEARLKYLLVGTALLAGGLGAAWYGGETWLGGKAREAVAASPVIAADSIAPLRDPRRIGLRLSEVEIGDVQNGLSAPGLEVYAPLTAPMTMTLALPPQLDLRVNAVPVAVTLARGQAHAAISPTRDMAISKAGISAEGLGIDGVPVLQSLEVDARLSHMGGAAPEGSRAGYAVAIDARGLTLGGFPDRLDLAGPLQLWLTEVPGQPMLEGRVPPPLLTGAQTQGLRVTLGTSQATLIGRIQADAQGFAAGEAAIYTSDAHRFVDLAVQAGLIPAEAVMLVRAVINTLSDTPTPAEAGAEAAPAQPAAAPPEPPPDADLVVSLPPAQKGQIRLPLFLRDGQLLLGPVPIGPAPRLIPG